MAVKYVPYFKEPIEGQAILDNFTRTKRILKYADNDKVFNRIDKGMPLYEVETEEIVGDKNAENLIIRGECVSACAYLKENDIKVDLVYIDPPFASGADYAKTIYIRRNPKVAEAIKKAEETLEDEELKTFEEKMYGDVWNKEAYLNWMYENLMAIKSIMSANASIYVHLDHHIGHYVKILMDEIFGEDNFKNEIVWCYTGGTDNKKTFGKKHDTIFFYTKSEEYTFNGAYEPFSEGTLKRFNKEDENGRYKENKLANGKIYKTYMKEEGKLVSDYWMIPIINRTYDEAVDYSTQKPEALLERIITASSNKQMLVADFFGGSGVTAKVANDLNRRFIHCDIGINSIETTRDRLKEAGASFKVLEIKDGVNLYRNPIQTMDKIKSLIPGLKNEDSVPEFWKGAINDSKIGLIPVYLPNLMDSTTKLLDVVLINKIINQAIPELDDNIKKVIIYYIDISDEKEIKDFIKEYLRRDIEIELRDLKEILDETIVSDIMEYHVKDKSLIIDKFISDGLIGKINEYNEKMNSQMLSTGKKVKNIEISDEGLELIEMISLDCTSGEGIWHSDEEIKIDKLGYVIKNGIKTKDLWDGTISFDKKPCRIKIRNIAGDETIISA
ncbi:MAG: site-specific DNA-methyltransferase [Firmicutes bacterium]|nr:site-specific DNA-methyltransferase [Bacillota bacterium]MDY5336368.1 site-specific DNA-methyltransferase [Bacilli bacterium]